MRSLTHSDHTDVCLHTRLTWPTSFVDQRGAAAGCFRSALDTHHRALVCFGLATRQGTTESTSAAEDPAGLDVYLVVFCKIQRNSFSSAEVPVYCDLYQRAVCTRKRN